MRKIYFLASTVLMTCLSFGQDMIISGVFDGPLAGGVPKAIEVYVVNDIADLSLYGVGSANNGGGTDGQEFTFAGSASAGDFIYVVDEGDAAIENEFMTYFGFTPDYIAGVASINGDDAVELFFNDAVIDTFGDINTDGSGEAWEYLDGWAYRADGSGPDGGSFILSNWTYSGINATDGCMANASCASVFPIGTYTTTPSTDPAITITSPSNGAELAPGTTSVDVEFTTANAGSATVNITVDGTTTTGVTSPFTVTTTDGESYDVTVELIDGSVLDTDMISFSVLSSNTVASIADLRAATLGQVYELTGEAIISFIVTDNRNQKYIQDDTAGVLIDDPSGVLTTTFNNGDGITGLQGQLSEFRGVLQFTPVANVASASTTGNTITPEVLTVSQFNADPEAYESELIKIDDIVFTNSGTFEDNTNYTISAGGQQGDPTMIARVSFGAEDLVGANIPTMASSVIGLGAQFNSDYQILPRYVSDVEGATLSINGLDAANFGMYPNPVFKGFVNITSTKSDAISVMVFDVLGKQVLTEILSNDRLNVSALNSGVYILKITQNNASITKKLVVK